MSRVTIRPANFDTDALVIVEGAKDFASRSVVKPLLGDAFVTTVSRIIALDGFELLLAEYQDQVVGGVGILYVPYIWNQDVLTAEQIFWWTLHEAPFGTGRDLINQIMINIDGKNAVPMFRALTSNRKGFDSVYRRLDMEPVETLYMRIPNAP